MASCFGEKLRVSVFGESHGNGIGALIEGLPAGEEVDFEQLKDIAKSEERFAKYSTIDKATTLDDLLNAQSLCNY